MMELGNAMDSKESAMSAGVTVRLVLVRHGEPEDSARGRCYGKLDVGLSDLGREHVRQTARWLDRIPFTAIYTSPRRRARDSAAIIAAHRLADVHVEYRLWEIVFAEFDAMTYA